MDSFSYITITNISATIFVFVYLFFIPRLLGFFLSTILKLKFGKSVYFKVQSLSFSLLRLKLFFKNFEYIDDSISIYINNGSISFINRGYISFDEHWIPFPLHKKYYNKLENTKIFSKCLTYIEGNFIQANIQEINWKQQTAIIKLVEKKDMPSMQKSLNLSDLFEIPLSKIFVPNDSGKIKMKINGVILSIHNKYISSINQNLSTNKLNTHLKNKLQFEKIMNFIKMISINMYAFSLNVFGLNDAHPYYFHCDSKFLNLSYSITRNDVSHMDLYRHVFNCFLGQTHMMWVHKAEAMDTELYTKNTRRNQSSFKSTIYQYISETLNIVTDEIQDKKIPDLYKNNSKKIGDDFQNNICFLDKPCNLRIMYYYDEGGLQKQNWDPNITLPKSGIEIDIDADQLIYSPWSDFCRKKIFEYFFPPSQLPTQPFSLNKGQLRPIMSFELLIEFVKECEIIIPFKHKSIFSVPPFFLAPTSKQSFISFHFKKCSTYTYLSSYIPNTQDHSIQTNAVLNAPNLVIYTSLFNSYLFKADLFELYIDSIYPKYYFETQRYEYFLNISSADLFYTYDIETFLYDLMDNFYYPELLTLNKPSEAVSCSQFLSTSFPYVSILKFKVIPGDKSKGLNIHFNANYGNVAYTDLFSTLKNSIVTVKLNSFLGQIKFSENNTKLDISYRNIIPFFFKFHRITVNISYPNNHFLYSDKESINILNCNSVTLQGDITTSYPGVETSYSQDKIHSYIKNILDQCLFGLALDVFIQDIQFNLRGASLRVVYNLLQNYNSSFISPEEFYFFTTQNDIDIMSRNLKKVFYEHLSNYILYLPNMKKSIYLTINKFCCNINDNAKNTLSFFTESLNIISFYGKYISQLTISTNPILLSMYEDSTSHQFGVIGENEFKLDTLYTGKPHYFPFADNISYRCKGLNIGFSIKHIFKLYSIFDQVEKEWSILDNNIIEYLQQHKQKIFTEPAVNFLCTELNDNQLKFDRNNISYFTPLRLISREQFDNFIAFIHEKDILLSKTIEYYLQRISIAVGPCQFALYNEIIQPNYRNYVHDQILVRCTQGFAYNYTSESDSNSMFKQNFLLKNLKIHFFLAKAEITLLDDQIGDLIEIGLLETSIAYRTTGTVFSKIECNSFYRKQKEFILSFDASQNFIQSELASTILNVVKRQYKTNNKTSLTKENNSFHQNDHSINLKLNQSLELTPTLSNDILSQSNTTENLKTCNRSLLASNDSSFYLTSKSSTNSISSNDNFISGTQMFNQPSNKYNSNSTHDSSSNIFKYFTIYTVEYSNLQHLMSNSVMSDNYSRVSIPEQQLTFQLPKYKKTAKSLNFTNITSNNKTWFTNDINHKLQLYSETTSSHHHFQILDKITLFMSMFTVELGFIFFKEFEKEYDNYKNSNLILDKCIEEQKKTYLYRYKATDELIKNRLWCAHQSIITLNCDSMELYYIYKSNMASKNQLKHLHNYTFNAKTNLYKITFNMQDLHFLFRRYRSQF